MTYGKLGLECDTVWTAVAVNLPAVLTVRILSFEGGRRKDGKSNSARFGWLPSRQRSQQTRQNAASACRSDYGELYLSVT